MFLSLITTHYQQIDCICSDRSFWCQQRSPILVTLVGNQTKILRKQVSQQLQTRYS